MAEENVEVPYYLMPVAALFGTYALIATCKALYVAYKSVTFKPSTTVTPPMPIASKQYFTLLLSILVSTLVYGYVCAQVNNSLVAADIFDPFEILAVDSSANLTSIKAAYRSLSKQHHPDKGGDASTFQRISLAYKALSDPVSRSNWETHGHPDGPQTQTLSFALPDWLLHPEGKVAAVLLLMYLGMFGALIAYVVTYIRGKEKLESKQRKDNSVAGSDMSYLATHLHPESSHMEVLMILASTPENIEITESNIEKAEEIKAARMEYLNPKKKKVQDASLFDMDEGGWADDGDESEEIKASKIKKEEESRLAKEVAQASGKDQSAKHIKIEGVDEGVLGQQWVENTLAGIGHWPPKLGSALEKSTFSLKGGRAVSALSHPGVRRNLCMTMGRLNAQKLNSHPELIEAGKKQLIDPTYFKSTVEYRQRTGLLLEAALRVATSTRCYRLCKTVIECVAMFKIGVMSVSDLDTIEWFRKSMTATYGGEDGLPRLIIGKKMIETPGEDEIATEDSCLLEVELTRGHTENFAKQKIQMAQKMGIPAEVALSSHREGWWVLLRAKKLDGDSENTSGHDGLSENSILSALDSGSKKKFMSEKEEDLLLTAWPLIVNNAAQKSSTAKIRFKAPKSPGRYEINVDIKSQDYLSCDEKFSLTIDVVDKDTLKERQEKEEEEERKHTEDKKTQ